MARIITLLLLLVLAVATLGLVVSRLGGARGDGTFRPRWRMGAGQPGGDGLVHLVRRDELAGVRDALTSAPIDPARKLARCGRCLAFYHADSAAALAAEQGGRCVGCGSRDIAPARVVDD